MSTSEKYQGKLFGSCCNGEVEIRSLTNAGLEEALEVFNNHFLPHESVCIGCEINLNLPQSLQARKELTELTRIIAHDGISLIAVDVPSQKIVAIAFNKIQCRPQPGELSFFEEYNNNFCTSPNAKALMEYMITMDSKIDAFELYNIDCLVEFSFLCTHTEFRGRGLGRALSNYTIQLARNLLNGIDIDLLTEKLQNKRPKAVTALFTSTFSQKIGESSGFLVLNRVPFTEFTFRGKTFASRIGPLHPFSTQVAIKL